MNEVRTVFSRHLFVYLILVGILPTLFLLSVLLLAVLIDPFIGLVAIFLGIPVSISFGVGGSDRFKKIYPQYFSK